MEKMNKELTPLEALKNIRELVNDIQYASKIPSIDNELDIIEKALKENAELKQMIRNFNEAIGEPQIITPSVEKNLKALDTIKQIFQFEVYEYEGSYFIRGSGSLSQIRKDAFDLLKEVLNYGK